jgi:hypothetical protein
MVASFFMDLMMDLEMMELPLFHSALILKGVRIGKSTLNMVKLHHSERLHSYVNSQANGNPERITFAFNYYGRFVDMGVSRGINYEKVEFSNRKAKPWYSKTFFGQLEKLK